MYDVAKMAIPRRLFETILRKISLLAPLPPAIRPSADGRYDKTTAAFTRTGIAQCPMGRFTRTRPNSAHGRPRRLLSTYHRPQRAATAAKPVLKWPVCSSKIAEDLPVMTMGKLI